MIDGTLIQKNSEIKKDDGFLRYAIWNAYDKKCAYTGEPLRYIDLEIDHIYPQKPTSTSISKEVEKFMKSKFKNGFEINSIENYLPTTKGPNKDKGNRLHDPVHLSFYFEKAVKHFGKVKKEYIKAQKNNDFDELISKLCTFELDKLRLEQLYANIEKGFLQKTYFDNQEDNTDAHFKMSTNNVSLQANITKDPDNHLLCLITFSQHNISGCSIWLDDERIKRDLFCGCGNKLNDGGRNFIIHRGDDDLPQTIQLGNIRLSINRDVLQQLCDIIDSFYANYCECRKQTINSIGASNFLYQHKGFKFASIPEEFWNVLVYLSRCNVKLYTNGEWVMFSSSLQEMCTLIEVLPHPIYRNANKIEPLCHFKLKAVKNYYTELFDIYWQTGSDSQTVFPLIIYDNVALWKVDFVSKWFLEQAIPMILSYLSLSECEKSNCSFSLLSSKGYYNKYDENHYLENYGVMFHKNIDA